MSVMITSHNNITSHQQSLQIQAWITWMVWIVWIVAIRHLPDQTLAAMLKVTHFTVVKVWFKLIIFPSLGAQTSAGIVTCHQRWTSSKLTGGIAPDFFKGEVQPDFLRLIEKYIILLTPPPAPILTPIELQPILPSLEDFIL